MLEYDKIQQGDLVNVNFNNSQFTLCTNAKVLHIPQSTGDSWVFKDTANIIYYISEGCTITKREIKNDT